MPHQHIDPSVELKHILDRLTFPKARDELLDDVRLAARDEGAVNLLLDLPADTYHSATEVMAALDLT